jgi:hypothetical protein
MTGSSSKTRQVHGVTLDHKSNRVTSAKRKRITALVDERLAKYQDTDESAAPRRPLRRSPRLKTARGVDPMPTEVQSRPPATPPVESLPADFCIEPHGPAPRVSSPRIISQEAVNFLTAKVWEDNTLGYVPTSLTPPAPQKNIAVPNLEHFCGPVVHPKTGEVITKYAKLANDPDQELRTTWRNAMGKEFGNMAQGDIKTGTPGMNAVFVLTHDKIQRIPRHKKITYARLVVNFRPQKADPNQVRMTAGGNLIEYEGELTTRTADLTTAKIVWNSVLSTPGAKYACFDISNMYLHTPLAPEDYKYIRILLAVLLEHIIERYGLRKRQRTDLFTSNATVAFMAYLKQERSQTSC